MFFPFFVLYFYYKDALKQNVVSPNLVEYYYENLHNNNNYEELEKLYNSLIPKKLSNIMHGKILYKLGKYYFNDNLTKSIELYIKSTSYENSNAMYELSIYYKSLNEIEKYIKYFNMAYDLNNENAKNNYNEFKEIKNKYLQNKKVIKQKLIFNDNSIMIDKKLFNEIKNDKVISNLINSSSSDEIF